jgi:superfamily II DNA or RNA helicase
MIEDRPRGMMLYHCMGSGKTISALAIAAALRSQREINDVVVLCPVNVKSAWEREAIRCGMLVEVMTHSSFQRYNYEKYKTLLIVDEAHNFRTLIKNKKKEAEDFPAVECSFIF